MHDALTQIGRQRRRHRPSCRKPTENQINSLLKTRADSAWSEAALAWIYAGKALREVGFSRDSLTTDVLFWETIGLDRQALDELVESLPDKIAEGQARDAQIYAEREAREAEARARDEAYIEGAREAARASLRTRRWSWAKPALIDEAQALIARPDLDRAGATRLIVLADQAGKNVLRSEQRTALPHEPEMERAKDPEIKQAAHTACRAITAFDQDWASIRNDIGWSRATTCDGHVLAGLDSLTVEQASHALRLLRVHHRQVPEALRDALFPTAQPTLSLSRVA